MNAIKVKACDAYFYRKIFLIRNTFSFILNISIFECFLKNMPQTFHLGEFKLTPFRKKYDIIFITTRNILKSVVNPCNTL